MLSAKLDLLMKKLDDKAGDKKEVMHIYDSHMTCEECGDNGHSGIRGLNKIKVGINRGRTTQVTIMLTILTTIIIIFHL